MIQRSPNAGNLLGGSQRVIYIGTTCLCASLSSWIGLPRINIYTCEEDMSAKTRYYIYTAEGAKGFKLGLIRQSEGVFGNRR